MVEILELLGALGPISGGFGAHGCRAEISEGFKASSGPGGAVKHGWGGSIRVSASRANRSFGEPGGGQQEGAGDTKSIPHAW